MEGVVRSWDLFGDHYMAYAAEPTHILNGHFKKATSTAVLQGIFHLRLLTLSSRYIYYTV